jgi:hypothetical protein
MKRFRRRQKGVSAEAGDSRSGLDFLAGSGLGDIMLGAVLCSGLALLLFFFKGHPLLAAILLTILALIVVTGTVAISARFRRDPRRALLIARDGAVALAVAALLVWTIWLRCSCSFS